MKRKEMSKKEETQIFVISVTLMLYVNRIYGMASINNDAAMIFVKDENAVDLALGVHMKDVITDFKYYKLIFGTGKEKKGCIDTNGLLDRVIFYHDLFIRDMLIRNLEKGASRDVNGVLDWNLNLNR
ncbi:TPA: hypothetical protein ACQ3C4_000660 [Klebsiella pneumoniae]